MSEETFFKATSGNQFRGVAVARGESMCKSVVDAIEAKGWTAHVITEFEFRVIIGGLEEESEALSAELVADRELSKTEAAALVGKYL